MENDLEITEKTDTQIEDIQNIGELDANIPDETDIVEDAANVSSQTEETEEELSILEVKHLIKKFGSKVAVNDASFSMKQGEIVGLLGPNGAGKTTIFYMIVGFIKPTSGDIFLDRHKITYLQMYRRAKLGISYLSQEASVFRKLTVQENIDAVLESLDISNEEKKRRKDEVMEDLGITRLSKQKAYSLSGGERRRTEIARALALKPKFLLLDEPFAGVDPIAVSDIQSIIGRLRQKNIGVLITDHNVRETLKITNRAYIINLGNIFRAGNAEELVNDQMVRKLYLGENFSF
ncbi:MAG TPA: LPS export ABC transporter ATP-binding protein [Spirochaetota bacterium]|nr:LPS export ABC transporter ATP-binding protein [Spirochaetota bacterium]HOS33047.1 LPS export ABC transporter ATP-binding protein [Spirochaetota bacterium]HOS55524.1 LPS export ABC transporter ATP-binding protein [Spirochaetota bacterium]HPK62576.1 LPS export ABC transporter ATP-binding protein [Spirochaetota bacterium]HQF78103.1 LPS export ABC transporter ATP-binding protein [Spirochaetota bacterium]